MNNFKSCILGKIRLESSAVGIRRETGETKIYITIPIFGHKDECIMIALTVMQLFEITIYFFKDLINQNKFYRLILRFLLIRRRELMIDPTRKRYAEFQPYEEMEYHKKI